MVQTQPSLLAVKLRFFLVINYKRLLKVTTRESAMAKGSNRMSWVGRDMAVDLGTANTLVYVRGR